MKPNLRILTSGVPALLAVILFTGCASREAYIARGRARLLASYPPGVTTRARVQERWYGLPPMESVRRPADGWEVGSDQAKSELRTGQRVELTEMRHGTNGMFGLCHCVYYYDRQDRLVDVDYWPAGD